MRTTSSPSLDELLARARLAPGQPVVTGEYGHVEGFTYGQVAGINTAWLAAIERLTPPNNPYRDLARSEINARGVDSGNAMTTIAGLMNALRADYERGYTTTVEELVHAEVFGDFIEMASELLDKGYQDPAAVLIGSVLEEHLRKLAARHGVATADVNGRPKKADTINAELTKGAAYNGLVQKQVMVT